MCPCWLGTGPHHALPLPVSKDNRKPHRTVGKENDAALPQRILQVCRQVLWSCVRLLWLPPTEGLWVFVRTRQVDSRASAYNICSSRLLSVLCCLQLHLLRSVSAVVLHKKSLHGMKMHSVFLMYVIDLMVNHSSMNMFRPDFVHFYLKCHNFIFQWNYSIFFIHVGCTSLIISLPKPDSFLQICIHPINNR